MATHADTFVTVQTTTAGRETAIPHAVFEIAPRLETSEALGSRIGPCPEHLTPNLWSIFIRDRQGFAYIVADFDTEEEAKGFLELTEAGLLDSAMSLWEAITTAPDGSYLWTKFEAVREVNGTCSIREDIAKLARAAHYGWLIAHMDGHGYDEAFDWEFCPWFLLECCDWRADVGSVILRPDWIDRCIEKRDG